MLRPDEDEDDETLGWAGVGGCPLHRLGAASDVTS